MKEIKDNVVLFVSHCQTDSVITNKAILQMYF